MCIRDRVTARPVFSVFGWTVLACTASMGLGMALFQLLGQGAQMVSLCVLTLYLVAMLIASIRQTYHLQAERQTAQFGVERACGRIAERYALSPRETEILAFLAHGRGAPYIGDKLCISPETVRTHTKRIYDKCGVHTKEELLDLVAVSYTHLDVYKRQVMISLPMAGRMRLTTCGSTIFMNVCVRE